MASFVPLSLAIIMGDLEEVERQITQHPSLLHAQDSYGSTPIVWAAQRSTAHAADIVRCLIRAGADVNHASDTGATALYCACSIGNGPVVRALLDGHADTPRATHKGHTSLMAAAAGGHLNVLRMLLAPVVDRRTQSHREGDMHARDGIRGFTALHWAVSEGRCAHCVAVLLEAGAEPGVFDTQEMTPLALARQKGLTACVALLESWERGYLLTKARFTRDAILLCQHTKSSRQPSRDTHGLDPHPTMCTDHTGIHYDSSTAHATPPSHTIDSVVCRSASSAPHLASSVAYEQLLSSIAERMRSLSSSSPCEHASGVGHEGPLSVPAQCDHVGGGEPHDRGRKYVYNPQTSGLNSVPGGARSAHDAVVRMDVYEEATVPWLVIEYAVHETSRELFFEVVDLC